MRNLRLHIQALTIKKMYIFYELLNFYAFLLLTYPSICLYILKLLIQYKLNIDTCTYTYLTRMISI